MSTPSLTPRALEICAKHWSPERTRCQGCPLLEPCSRPVRPMTLETISAHVAGVNLAAEQKLGEALELRKMEVR